MKKIPVWEQVYRNAQLTPMILVVLREGSMDAYVIQQRIEEITNFGLEYNLVSVYRTLRRLKQAGLVDMRLLPQENMPAAKIYSLSKRGSKQLHAFIARTYTWR